MNKKIIMLPGVLVLFAILLFSFSVIQLLNSKPQNRQSVIGQMYEVILTDQGFSPSEILIKPGDSIKFSSTLDEPFWPASDLHPTHGIYPEFDPQAPVEPNASWRFQFLKTGTWKYHDHLSPFLRGTITVK